MASQAVLTLIAELTDNASSGLASIGDTLGTLGTVAAGIAAAGIVAVGAALVSGMGDAREANLILAQTEQTIKSTGGIAGVTATQVTDLATALSAAKGKSLFGDDLIQNAENVLLTFTNIGQEVFPLATQATVDMAQALHKTPEAMSMMIGKALNSAEGFTALKKSGVAFTESQEAMIKELFATGHAAEAQKIILAELATEFGGQAEAAAAADGGWAQFNDRMGEAAETAGAAVLPLLSMLAGFLLDPVMPAIEAVAGAFAAWLGDASTQAAIQALGDTISTVLGTAFAFLANEAIPALLAGWAAIQPAIETVTSFISANLEPILYGMAAIFMTVIVPAFVAWAIAAGAAAIATIAALAPILIPLAAIGVAVALLKAAWDSDFGGIRTTLTQFWEQTGRPIFDQLVAWLGTNIPAAVAEVSAFFTDTLWPALKTVWAFIDANVIPIVSALANVWFALLKKEVEALAALWTGVLWPALQTVGGFITGTLIPTIQTLSQDAMNGAKVVSDALAGVITNVLGPAFEWLTGNVIDPAIDGFGYISSAVDDVIGFLNRLANSINAIEIPDWLQGHSPPPLADWFRYIGDAILGIVDDVPVLETAMAGMIAELQSQVITLRASLEDAGDETREAIQQEITDMENQIRTITGLAAKLPDLIADATAGLFDIDADYARTLERNMARLEDFDPQVRGMVELDLSNAEAEMAKIADPEEAQAFFALRSKQIFEMAALEKQSREAGAADRLKIETEHAREAESLLRDRAKLEQDLAKANENETKKIADLQAKLLGATTDEQRAQIRAQIAEAQRAAEVERKRIADAIALNERAQAAEEASYQRALALNEQLATAERARLNTRMTLLGQAHAAELEALKVRREHELSMFEELAARVSGLFSAIPTTMNLPANWVASIQSMHALVTQLNLLYSQPAPAWLPPAGGQPGGQGIAGSRGPALAGAGGGGGSIILQPGAIVLNVIHATEAEARRLADMTIKEIDRRRTGRRGA